MIKLQIKFDETVIFSDLHYGHDREFIWKARGFNSPEEHDKYMLHELSSIEQHATISLGDISYRCDQARRSALVDAMRVLGKQSQFCCISGNHDLKFLNQEFPENTHEVVRLGDMAILQEGLTMVVISHYPFLEWPHKFHDALHLHGHCHGNLSPDLPTTGRMDCSADCLMRIFGGPVVTVSEIVSYIRDRDAGV